jgi:hypothetical protein
MVYLCGWCNCAAGVVQLELFSSEAARMPARRSVCNKRRMCDHNHTNIVDLIDFEENKLGLLEGAVVNAASTSVSVRSTMPSPF